MLYYFYLFLFFIRDNYPYSLFLILKFLTFCLFLVFSWIRLTLFYLLILTFQIPYWFSWLSLQSSLTSIPDVVDAFPKKVDFLRNFACYCVFSIVYPFTLCSFGKSTFSMFKDKKSKLLIFSIWWYLNFHKKILSLHKISCTRQFESKLSLCSFALSLHKISCTW